MEATKLQMLSSLMILSLLSPAVVGNLFKPSFLQRSRVAREVAYTVAQDDSQIGNLHGKTGEGYYMEVYIGTPRQKVGDWLYLFCLFR